jgi:hypothetical protein
LLADALCRLNPLVVRRYTPNGQRMASATLLAGAKRPVTTSDYTDLDIIRFMMLSIKISDFASHYNLRLNAYNQTFQNFEYLAIT